MHNHNCWEQRGTVVSEKPKSWNKHEKWIREGFYCTVNSEMDRLAAASCQCFLLSLEDVFREALERVWLSALRKRTETWETWQRISLALAEFDVKTLKSLGRPPQKWFPPPCASFYHALGPSSERKKSRDEQSFCLCSIMWSMGTVLKQESERRVKVNLLGFFPSFEIWVVWFTWFLRFLLK